MGSPEAYRPNTQQGNARVKEYIDEIGTTHGPFKEGEIVLISKLKMYGYKRFSSDKKGNVKHKNKCYKIEGKKFGRKSIVIDHIEQMDITPYELIKFMREYGDKK